VAGGVSETPTGFACSIATTLEVVGDRWSLLILRNVFRGVRRFSAIQEDLGIARNLLTDRLNKLVEHDVLRKERYQDRPPRYEYRLTAKGADLSTSLIALMRWGDRWYAGGDGPVVLVHDTCDSPLDHRIRCPTCDEPVSPQEIRSLLTEPTPGAPTP
jgi:DNA-binding HxlR family transcriptional regulator